MLMTKITPEHIHARARSSVVHFFEYLYPLLHPKRPIEMDWYIHAMSGDKPENGDSHRDDVDD